MAQVTYRGKVEALQGSVWAVPDSVIQASQAGAWIESQAREQEARAVAAAEAERRQQELLAARLEQQRAAAANAVESAPISREELKAELRDELDVLAQNVMSAGAAIVGRGEAEAAARAEWEGRHESLLAKQEETAAVAADQVVAAQAASQSAVERVAAELSELRERNAELERELRQTVSTLRGPQGETGERGLAGSGIGYVDADPTRIEQGSLGQRFYGRPVVPGDILLQRTPDALLVWRTADGKTWAKVDEIINKQELVSQPISVLDASTKVNATLPPQNQQQGEGSSPDTILTRTMGQRTNLRLAGLDRFDAAGFNDLADSALVSIELTALDGTRAGENGTWLISIAQRTGGICEQQIYACLGPLADAGMAPDIDIRSVSTYTKPAGVTGAFPPSATKHLVCLGWTEEASGLVGRPNQVAIKGWCKWNLDSRVIQATPAWKLSDEL